MKHTKMTHECAKIRAFFDRLLTAALDPVRVCVQLELFPEDNREAARDVQR